MGSLIARNVKHSMPKISTPKSIAPVKGANSEKVLLKPSTVTAPTKKLKNAVKLLASDERKETTAQDKAGRKATARLQNIQDKAMKDTQKTTGKQAKSETKILNNVSKDQTSLAKATTRPKKCAAKDIAKAQEAVAKDVTGLTEIHQSEPQVLQKINDKEDKSLAKTQASLQKGLDHAHNSQFNRAGVAKEHPSTWQKFKKVMSYIGTGLVDLVPGVGETVGIAATIARSAVAVGKAIAKGVAKVAVKEGNHVAKDDVKNVLNSQPQKKNPVTAGKTELVDHKATAQGNANGIMAAYQSATTAVQHLAGTPISKRGADVQSQIVNVPLDFTTHLRAHGRAVSRDFSTQLLLSPLAWP
ncbi:hypothetical protein MMC19_002677 [Ptychographa xylographoides]|nr:hypothetical protein [Ptychographa xylographoides]